MKALRTLSLVLATFAFAGSASAMTLADFLAQSECVTYDNGAMICGYSGNEDSSWSVTGTSTNQDGTSFEGALDSWDDTTDGSN
ncbi:MAG: hypothetical protein R3310_09600 [Candidatus Competibacteraceae bacterium]|nr:hypothetical protein [Candidatus Competibacteraceae bacterium]